MQKNCLFFHVLYLCLRFGIGIGVGVAFLNFDHSHLLIFFGKLIYYFWLVFAHKRIKLALDLRIECCLAEKLVTQLHRQIDPSLRFYLSWLVCLCEILVWERMSLDFPHP